MSIHQTAYDTVACRGSILRKTTEALQAAEINGSLMPLPESFVQQVRGGNTWLDAVPAFSHPMLFEDRQGVMRLAVDVRPFGTWNAQQHEFHVRNKVDYDLTAARARLNEIWLEHSPSLLRDISTAPLFIYSSWLSEAITRRFALDPREQLDLAIVSGVFYCSLFTDAKELGEPEKMRVVAAITRALRCSAEDVLAVVDQVSVIGDVHEFCLRAAEVTKSVRLKELNAGVLFAIVGGTWFGFNARELAAVAIEHPPTWIAMLIAAFNERSFKNSALSKLSERTASKDIGRDFLRATMNLLSKPI